MKEHPIIFSGAMVREILNYRKTQTRRVIKPQPTAIIENDLYIDNPIVVVDEKTGKIIKSFSDKNMNRYIKPVTCPYGRPGDRLWVREAFAPNYFYDGKTGYKADWTSLAAEYVDEPRWYPSIHMPRYLSRITLEITNIRAELLLKISRDDAFREGVEAIDPYKLPGMENIGVPLPAAFRDYQDANECCFGDPIASFFTLWDRINAGKGYPAQNNPWVWVIEFKRIER